MQPGWFTTLRGAGRRVIAFDNRGHGQSAKLYDPADYHTTKMAADARALLAHLGIGRADVMGYSMGARITAFLALESPELTRSIVLGGLGIHLVDGVGLPESIADAMEAPSLADVTDPQGYTFRSFADKTRSDRRALAACIRGSRQEMTREQAGSIRTPALVAIGTRDLVAGSPDKLVALMPNAARAADPGPRSHDRGGRQGLQGRRAGVSRGSIHDAAHRARGCDVHRGIGQHARRRRLWRGGRAGAAAARRRPDPARLEEDRRADRAHGPGGLRGRPARPRRFRMGQGRRLSVRRLRRRRARARRYAGRNGAACARWRSARRLAAWRRCWPTAAGRARCFPRWCWSTSPRASTATASPRSRVSCARSCAKALAPLPRRPTRWPPICRTGHGRARTRGLKKNLRLHPDGRWRWHWDPKFLEGNRRIGAGSDEVERKLVEAARRTTIPALLVRGASSELVGEEHAKDFLKLVPHATLRGRLRRPPYGRRRPQRSVRKRHRGVSVRVEGLA